MLPLQDINPRRRFPILMFVLIGINVLVFLWEMSMGEQQLSAAFQDLSVVPRNLTANPFSLESLLDCLRSMFFHGGIAHIGGNMLYLYLFGDNVEDRLGMLLFIVLYFISGFVAIIAQVLVDPQSTVPLIGASGAIAGVLGAYLVMFPGVKVRGIIPIGRISSMQEWPAYAVLGLWFVTQLFNGIGSLGANAQAGGGVAFFAHVGGFIAGALIAFLYTRAVPQPPAEERREALYQRTQRTNF
ncbi:MAG: rhomboid family intramembrane serine protease [Burkholderiales bacterium]|nr:rhomboid family intramembrane serine protease [Anaerolineae bacterium]